MKFCLRNGAVSFFYYTFNRSIRLSLENNNFNLIFVGGRGSPGTDIFTECYDWTPTLQDDCCFCYSVHSTYDYRRY